MKKILLLCLCLAMQSLVFATNRVATHEEELPAPALEFINTYFKDVKVEKVIPLKKKRTEVKLSDTTRICFDKKGAWYSVKNSRKGVPEVLVPEKIRRQIAERYKEKDLKYLRVSYEDKKYKVRLSNKFNVFFDKELNLLSDYKSSSTMTINGVTKDYEDADDLKSLNIKTLLDAPSKLGRGH